MVEDYRSWVRGAVVGTVMVALAFGPLVAGFAVAAVAFAFIVGLMGAQAARSVGDWRLDHPRVAHLHLRPRRVR